jgi:hypothetical protein
LGLVSHRDQHNHDPPSTLNRPLMAGKTNDPSLPLLLAAPGESPEFMFMFPA